MRLPMLVHMPLLTHQLVTILPRKCPNLLPSRHRRRTIHHLRDQVPINRLSRILQRKERTLPIADVAGDGGRTADSDGVGADLAEGVGELDVV